jgi:hypothetical protein
VSPPARRRSPAPQLPPEPPSAPGDRRPSFEIHGDEQLVASAPVSGLTSPGLDSLKALINEAAIRRAELAREVSTRKAALARAQKRLDRAQGFVTRLAWGKSAPQRAREVQAAETAQLDSEARLDGCHVEIDFGLDGQANATFEALTEAFLELCRCERIWDITATSAIRDRVAARTLASTAVRRTRVAFALTEPELIRCPQAALKLGNVGGRDLQIYPGFLMMRDAHRDFALIEFRDLNVRLQDSPFLEEEHVPADARVIGETWKKANKDGSRDQRFKENYSIPIVRYAELDLRSDAGVLEAYQFSDCAKAQAFLDAYDSHRRALAALVSREGVAPAPVDDELPPPDPEAEEAAAMARVKPLGNLWLDWATLATLAVALTLGGLWVRAGAAPPPTSPVVAAAPVAAPAKTRIHHHRRARHHTPAASPTT